MAISDGPRGYVSRCPLRVIVDSYPPERGGVNSGSSLNNREHASSLEHRQLVLDHRPQPSSTVRTTARSVECGFAMPQHSDQPRCKVSGHASRLQACWKRAEHVTADDRLSSSTCARDECVSSFWIVETMICNRVLASSTCHLPPSAHPIVFRAESWIGPDGSTTWRPCRSQRCSGSCRACEDRLGCEFTKQLTTYLQRAAAPIRSRSTSDATYHCTLEALATA